MPEEYGYGVRQYTGDILLVWSRYSSDIYKELGNYEELWILYSSLYNDKNITEGVIDLIEKYEVDYLVVYNDTKGIEVLGETSKVMWSDENFSLIRL